MNSISDLIRKSGPYENIIQQLVQLESQTKYKLQAKQSDERNQKKALGEVSSSISKFINKIDEFNNPTNHPFQPLSTSSTDDSVVRVDSASGLTKPADYNITVHRLASRDNALSQVMAGDGTDLAAYGSGTMDITIGTQTETITVDTTKTDGSGNTVNKTNKEILQSFSDQINNLFGDQAKSSVFQVDKTNVQLSTQSLETGYDQRIQMNGATGVLAQIQSGMTRPTPQSDLDASFTIDGVTFTRGQNTVDDAINGLTFTLRDDTGTQQTMSVQRDLDKAKDNVKSFIDTFNKMNGTIRTKTFIDAQNDREGVLHNQRSIRNLTMNLRQTALQPMSGAPAGNLKSLSEIGISIKNDGTMYIEDSSALDQALTDRPDEVAELFTNDNSAVASMKSQAEMYTKSKGIIPTLEDGIDERIDFLDRRIKRQDHHLEKYEERQRAKFNELERITTMGQNQFNQVVNFQSKLGF